jgi:hypothetical protein
MPTTRTASSWVSASSTSPQDAICNGALHTPLAAGTWLLAAGCWLLAAGCWLLAAGTCNQHHPAVQALSPLHPSCAAAGLHAPTQCEGHHQRCRGHPGGALRCARRACAAQQSLPERHSGCAATKREPPAPHVGTCTSWCQDTRVDCSCTAWQPADACTLHLNTEARKP